MSIEEAIAKIIADRRIPLATYRLQFNEGLTFQDAAGLVDYLHTLGVSDIYASPLYKARADSTHGYDVVDYNQLNPKLGTEDDFNHLIERLHEHGMSLLLDIVPNHMGVDTDNRWWMDVLKHGPSSEFAHYFDINWRPINRAIDNKVLLPVLGDHYGRVLEDGEFELVYWHGDFYLHYYDHQFPITPGTYRDILEHVTSRLEGEVIGEVLSISRSLEMLPPYTTRNQEQIKVMRREQHIARQRLLDLWNTHDFFRDALAEALSEINGTPGEPASFDRLDAIINRQPYRLSYWRVATDEINYRRFFDINDLAAMRIEAEDVFADVHETTMRLLAAGKVTGLRVDHPDGLWDPPEYFRRLQEAYVTARLEHERGEPVEDEAIIRQTLDEIAPTHGEMWRWPLYVIVEKILSEREPLPYTWAVYGTTGYDFLNAANNLFVDSTNEETFDEIYASFSGEHIEFDTLTDSTSKMIMEESLASELEARSSELAAILEHNRRYRGFTQRSLWQAMGEVIAGLAVYRTYITAPDDVTNRDRYYIRQAVRVAKRRNPSIPASIFDFLQDTLLLANIDEFDEPQQEALIDFVMKFQQITGPVMAKSVEDTAFYIYNRLVSLNEVGGHPDVFGFSVRHFHEHNRNKDFPYTMLGSSTHDTKRSEDVRARINVLSEIPEEWQKALTQWAADNQDAKAVVNGEPAPSRNDEYLIYQTLLGACPQDKDQRELFCKRMQGYIHKAINEAKVHSNWLNPNHDYIDAATAFIEHVLYDEDFLETFEPLLERVTQYGYLNSLGEVTLKITSPGVPDLYQGNEMWRYSLVDPDNRRPVDFEQRRRLLDDLNAAEDRLELARELVEHVADGRIKLYVNHRLLDLRREHPAIFLHGDYEIVEVEGLKSRHVCAYLRRSDDDIVMVVVPRLVVGLTEGTFGMPVGEQVWRDTTLSAPAGTYRDVFTGETVETEGTLRVKDVLTTFPVAVLIREQGDDEEAQSD